VVPRDADFEEITEAVFDLTLSRVSAPRQEVIA